MSASFKGERPPIDPQWTRIQAIGEVKDAFTGNFAASTISVNPKLDLLRVLAGTVEPLERDGYVRYRGLSLVATRLTTQGGVDVCELWTAGSSNDRAFFDLGQTAQQLLASPISQYTARAEAYFTRLLDRTDFDAELSEDVSSRTIAQPDIYVGPAIARYLLPRAIEA